MDVRIDARDISADRWGARWRRDRLADPRADEDFRDLVKLCATYTGIFGFTQGFVSGFRFRGLQFLAENAHRAPRTKGEWYFYHKTKRYQMLSAGLKKGALRATLLAAVPTTLLCTSELVQRLYMNATTRPAGEILRPQRVEDVPLGVRAVGCSVGGLALGVGAHRYLKMPDFHRRLVYTRCTLAGFFMGGLLELWWYSKLHWAERTGERPESISDGIDRLAKIIKASLSTQSASADTHSTRSRLSTMKQRQATCNAATTSHERAQQSYLPIELAGHVEQPSSVQNPGYLDVERADRQTLVTLSPALQSLHSVVNAAIGRLPFLARQQPPGRAVLAMR